MVIEEKKVSWYVIKSLHKHIQREPRAELYHVQCVYI